MFHLVRRFREHTFLALAIIVILALAIRYLVSLQPYVAKGDESVYLTLGKNLAEGKGFAVDGRPEVIYNPLFPMLVALGYLLTGALEPVGIAIFIVTGSLLVIPVFMVTRAGFGRSPAFLAAAMVAVYPVFTTYLLYQGFMSEMPYLLLVYVGLASSFFAIRGGSKLSYLGAGVSFALAYLTRTEGVLFFAMFLALFAAIALLAARSERIRIVTGITLFVLGFSILSAPYIAHLQRATGQFMLSGKPWITYVMNRYHSTYDAVGADKLNWSLDETGDEVNLFSLSTVQRSMLDEVLHNPQDFVSHLIHNLKKLRETLGDNRVLPEFILFLIAVGLFRKPWTRADLQANLVLLLGVIGALVPAILTDTIVRFMTPIFPPILIWSAVGVAGVSVWARQSVSGLLPGRPLPERCAPLLGAIVAVLTLAYFGAAHPSAVAHGLQPLQYSLVEKEVGLKLNGTIPKTAKVVSREGLLTFYAGVDSIPFPAESFDDVMRYARLKKADYLEVSEKMVKEYRPNLISLLDESRPHEGLSLVTKFATPQGKILLYKIQPQDRHAGQEVSTFSSIPASK